MPWFESFFSVSIEILWSYIIRSCLSAKLLHNGQNIDRMNEKHTFCSHACAIALFFSLGTSERPFFVFAAKKRWDKKIRAGENKNDLGNRYYFWSIRGQLY